MNKDELHISRLIFQNKALKADGQAYEDLFIEVMTQADPDFRPVKPQGSKGDRKNDGFNQKTGTYYQSYAPENLKADQAIKKLNDTLPVLIEHWSKISPIKRFFFVLKDDYKGTYPDIEKALSEAVSKHDFECAPFLCKDLENTFLSLMPHQIPAVIGFQPSPDSIETIEYSVLSETIEYLLGLRLGEPSAESRTVPDFDGKIQFNSLSSVVSELLTVGSYQVGQLQQYFEANSNFARDDLKEIFVTLYEDAQTIFPLGRSENNDAVFIYILTRAMSAETESCRDAVLVLMAYYFETCDIFEEPTDGEN